jgi:hypothetical protein
MANSTYDILETRLVYQPDTQSWDAYICISHPTDSLPIGGWYKKPVPPDQDALAALGKACDTQEYLLLAEAGWSYPCVPPEGGSFGLQGGHDVLVGALFALVASLVEQAELHRPTLSQVYGNLEVIKEASQKMANQTVGRTLYGQCLDLSLEMARKISVFQPHGGPQVVSPKAVDITQP